MNISEFNKPVKRTGILADLTEAQHQQLKKWLNSPQTYEETIKKLAADFGKPNVTTSTLKNYRKKYCTPNVQTLVFCPPFVARATWEFSITKLEVELQNPDTPIEIRIRVMGVVLQIARMTIEQNKLSAKARGPRRSKAKAAEPNTAEEPNPLDDDDKLDEVRRQVFGSAPQS